MSTRRDARSFFADSFATSSSVSSVLSSLSRGKGRLANFPSDSLVQRSILQQDEHLQGREGLFCGLVRHQELAELSVELGVQRADRLANFPSDSLVQRGILQQSEPCRDARGSLVDSIATKNSPSSVLSSVSRGEGAARPLPIGLFSSARRTPAG